MQPLVSVCLITYKQEQYIRQAIESVLMQKVGFPWEIIIADDCSPDATRAIILEYQQKYPELIRLVFQESNVGGGRNFVDLINAAKGKYIAYLEGDDYWTKPYKLQSQYDLMEGDPGLSLCYHKINWTWTYESSDDPNMESNKNDPPVSTIVDVLNKGWFIRSCTMFFKNMELPTGFENLHVGDYPLHVLLADKGNIGFIPISMGVYRINDKGQSETKLVTTDVKKRSKNLRAEVYMLKYLDQHTEYRYHSIFSRKQVDVLYGHLHFLQKNSSIKVSFTTALNDLVYSARSIGVLGLLKGMFYKAYMKVKA